MNKVSFYVKDGELISATQREDRASPLEVPLPLDEMNAKGFSASAEDIGTLVLIFINKWNPEVFKNYQNLQK